MPAPYSNKTNPLNILTFPPGLGSKVAAGQHYLMIDSYKSLNAINTGDKKESSIALYIPPNSMKTGFSAEYSGQEGAALKAAAFTGAKGAASAGANAFLGQGSLQAGVGNLAGMMADSLTGSLGSIASGGGSFLQGAAAKLADKAGFGAAAGIAVNNHMALVYKCPSEFRTHDFMFSFWPKDPSEAEIVARILNDFKQGMLPRVGGGQINSRRLSAPFFHAPRHWKLKFCMGGVMASSENPYLFEIKTSVIKSMQVNHDPEGIVSFHPDGSPVHTTLSLSFQEIELVTSADAVDSVLDTALNQVVKNQAQAATAEELSRISGVAVGTGSTGPPGRNYPNMNKE